MILIKPVTILWPNFVVIIVQMLTSKFLFPDEGWIETSVFFKEYARNYKKWVIPLIWKATTDRRPPTGDSSSSLLLSSLELSDTQSRWALNTSPPRNRCTFTWSSCSQIENHKGFIRRQAFPFERLLGNCYKMGPLCSDLCCQILNINYLFPDGGGRYLSSILLLLYYFHA